MKNTLPVLRTPLPRKDNGAVDWRQIVSPEHVYLNARYYARSGVDVAALSDDEIARYKQNAPEEGLIVRLGGFRQIAFLRGVKATRFRLEDRRDSGVVVSAELTLVPTEEEPYEVIISGLSNYNLDSGEQDKFKFAEALASNRAECRAWRQYLNMSAVGDDELDPKEKIVIADLPVPGATLAIVLKEHGLGEKDVPRLMKEGGYTLGADWNGSLGSLAPAAIFTLIDFVVKKK